MSTCSSKQDTSSKGTMSGSQSADQKKWSCEYCTYDNWPASKKCTLCQAPRHPQLITDSVNEEKDIYKMAALAETNNTICSGGESSSNQAAVGSNSDSKVMNAGTGGNGSGNKWACIMCTFLNWPRAVRCSQCLSSRQKNAPVQSSSPVLPATTTNSSITGSRCDGDTGTGSANSNSPSLPDIKSVNSDNKSVTTSSRSASSVMPASQIYKWSCKVCTYENFPRAAKCTLCGTPRGRTLSDSSGHHTSGPPTNVSTSRSELRNISKHQGHLQTEAHPVESVDSSHSQDLAGATGAGTSFVEDCQLQILRRRLRDKDWLWLNACQGVVDGDPHAIEAFIRAGGNPSRQLTADEVLLLSRPSAFEVGHTLVHLALRFRHEDMLAVLLAATDAASKCVKRLPCHASPDLAADIRRHIASSLRQRKGDFPCFYFSDFVTFALPTEIVDLPRETQELLMDELLDRTVQNELEVEESIINWSTEVMQLGSRLYALWNRTAGDCLLDSILQVTWGVFDADNTLRRALADSLTEGAMVFYPRWKEYESKQAESMHFSLDEYQWQRDWAVLLSLASQPGASLEQTHIFALAHILRRPIIVYGVKYVKSFRGETLGFAKFQGVYLPLLWERSFCWRSPVALGYTRGHFSALVSMETDVDEGEGAGANHPASNEEEQMVYLPLVDCQGKLLDVHFLSASEIGREESLLQEWIDCFRTKGGLLVAVQRRGRQPVAVKQMLEEWLDRYRQLPTSQEDPSPLQQQQQQHHNSTSNICCPHEFSSDDESDQE
ncbi:ubiquitin thioesterase ZRANB1-like [Babylonia areolata]|uniref:ubiquitin thioesterase ZRANB1-like n=1 Tax=Babylonia areolata TaxID=304850 RepID=UPI003FCF8582